ncbi:hypothetical protein V6N11_008859 [Hibiscus sabdariffa]|uniref:Uncharacterized protein n=1 Tax=Hibiscus sabdariffa TaxID=183260 RepID=A0ABR2NBF1_9ROSI
MEIPNKGGAYTWSNKRCDEDAILENLDKALASLECNFLFPQAIAVIDVAIASDHAPIILLTNGIMNSAKKDFMFESSWFNEEECSQVIKEAWDDIGHGVSRSSFQFKLRRTWVQLTKWNKEKLGRNILTTNDIIGKIKNLQDALLSVEEASKLKELKDDLMKMWAQVRGLKFKVLSYYDSTK